MIKSFADKKTQLLFTTGKAKGLDAKLTKRALRRLEYVHLAARLEDLRVPPSNRLHALGGDRQGQYAVWVNNQWRICFHFKDSDAYDVELTDYH